MIKQRYMGSLTGSGIKDWIIQRVTSMYLLFYFLWFSIYWLFCHRLTYDNWVKLFNSNVFKVSSVLTLFFLNLHVWIGLWTIITDYVKKIFYRLLLYIVVYIYLMIQFIYGVIVIFR
ncbi:succinate dehydrogenase, hydrophobic membrane anchor protein [Candidatus Legionella polyplacis]|uniref:Succinate dehydrogenase hydrophobic membrane anchor subunit n=1 Tax=Candidatus Legionella polyplacis TaxID=2005262 RepID=A0ABZ2GZS0_9GAMM